MHRLHERDVRVDGLLMRSERVGDETDRTDGPLDGVEQGETGEHAHGKRMLRLAHAPPYRQVVGDRHLLRQPEVAGQTVPHLEVLVVLEPVPVDGAHAVDELKPLPRYGYRCHDGRPF